MIKVFLKHVIYEKCIQVLFNGIARNFGKMPKREILPDHVYREVQFIRTKNDAGEYIIDILCDVRFGGIGEHVVAYNAKYATTICSVFPDFVDSNTYVFEDRTRSGMMPAFDEMIDYRIMKE